MWYKYAILIVLSAWAGHEWSDRGWSQRWAERDTADAAARVAMVDEARRTEQRWQTKINEVQADAKNHAEILAADAAELNDTVSELRKSLRLSTAAGSSATATIAELRRTAATNAVVRQRLCGWTIERAKELAAIADRNRAAGLACQRAYEGINNG